MVSFTTLLTAVAAAATSVTASPIEQLTARGIQPGQGTHNGFFYSYWKDNGGTVDYNNGERGSYNVRWTNVNNWVGGKGWKPGPPRKVAYNGTWNNYNVNSYLALYGWTTNPLVEYYIVEAYGVYNPSSGTQRLGTIEDDGGVYDIYKTRRVNQPSIVGTASFDQYWSVRRVKRVGGTIDTGKHFDEWKRQGNLQLGQWDYMIMASEGYQSSGSATIEVRQG
ncbi:Xyn11A [Podospora aff. communis PSN243]|uniref:Endo-1,4-beta-xylanase n=1 Tax=Podospora aff. communis PSN243 TaxID=3040156 RepID=A0AAV9G5H6_9PEZI|nr:Xyn11A [Podospora aff. communis PSN243]